jgi:acyl-CoA reductase-like NAD-dependent aldehyde dehydrogenase
MFALNQGEICTTPSRILVHEDIADLFIERMQARLKLVKAGNPLDPETMIGSQVSKAQCDPYHKRRCKVSGGKPFALDTISTNSVRNK